jgi:hypothetical protein
VYILNISVGNNGNVERIINGIPGTPVDFVLKKD